MATPRRVAADDGSPLVSTAAHVSRRMLSLGSFNEVESGSTTLLYKSAS